MRLAYLGPPGTFSEEAARRYAPDADLQPCLSFRAAAQAVVDDAADEAILAIENSLEGSVPETLDLLIHEVSLCIRREIVLPIEQCLIVGPRTDPAAVRTVYSHPQALGQCREYLRRHYPDAATVASLSTVAAVEMVIARPAAAAIGPRRAAELHGARIVAAGIQDDQRNRTRFVVVGHADAPPTGDDKTSLAFSVQDRPGALVRVLQIFADARINLTKIESRPARAELGAYIFLLDCHGHRTDPAVAAALDRLAQETTMLKVFGSYPRYRA